MNARFILVPGALLAIAAVALLQQHHAISELQVEREELSGESRQVQQLVEQNKDIEHFREELGTAEKLRADNAELLRLRGEVTRLRNQVTELSNPPATGRPVSASGQAAGTADRSSLTLARTTVFLKAGLTNQGFALPKATIQTYYWAMSQGDVKGALDCLTPSAQAVLQTQPEESLKQKMLQETSGFTGYEIATRTVVSTEEIVLGIKLLGSDEMHLVHFKLISDGWRIDQ